MAIAANSAPHSLICVYVRLGSPVFQVVALSARLDEISLPPAAQSEPLFGLFGPSGRPRGPLPPSNCIKFAGVEAPPPLRPPLRRCAAPWLGYAQPEAQIKAPPSAEDRGQPQSKTHRTQNSVKSSVLG
jgi:hypothetical protein